MGQQEVDSSNRCDRTGRLLPWLVVLLVLVHATQISLDLLQGVARQHLNVCPADLVLGVAWGVWLVRRLLRRDWSLPPFSVAALAGAVWLALSLIPALKGPAASQIEVNRAGVVKVAQFIEYFIIAYMMLAEVLKERCNRRLIFGALALVVVVVLGWGGIQYLRSDIPVMAVRGPGFDHRNAFAAFLALAVPFVWGRSLFSTRTGMWIGGALMVLIGLAVCLAGGAFLAMCLGVLTSAALRSRRALGGATILLGVFIVGILPYLPRDNAAILKDSLLLYRDRDPHAVLSYEENGTKRNPLEAARKREAERRAGRLEKLLNDEPLKISELPTEADFVWRWRQSVLERQAAINMIAWSPLFGVGAGSYQNNVNRFYAAPAAHADEAVEAESPLPKYHENLLEPGTLSGYMVWTASAGIPFLLILVCMALTVGRSGCRAVWTSQDLSTKGIGAGLVGTVASLAVLGCFTNPLVRGIGMLLALLYALSRAVADEAESGTAGHDASKA